jgi:hypothetical protein
MSEPLPKARDFHVRFTPPAEIAERRLSRLAGPGRIAFWTEGLELRGVGFDLKARDAGIFFRFALSMLLFIAILLATSNYRIFKPYKEIAIWSGLASLMLYVLLEMARDRFGRKVRALIPWRELRWAELRPGGLALVFTRRIWWSRPVPDVIWLESEEADSLQKELSARGVELRRVILLTSPSPSRSR